MSDISNEKIRNMLEEIMFPELPYRSVEKDYDNPEYLNPEICKECGGECCQRCGCSFSPDDFEEISFEYLRKQIEKGYISIDCVDAEAIYDDFGVYILRMRNQGAPIVDTEIRPRTPCILWNKDTGCKFDYEHRPTGGRLVTPKKGRKKYSGERMCEFKYTLMKCCYEWKPHQRILSELIQYFIDKDFECSL